MEDRSGGRVRKVSFSPGVVKRAAELIGDPRLVPLFVEAQFHAMPREWCMEKFGRPYPPVSVAFGGNSDLRYAKYLEEGKREPLAPSGPRMIRRFRVRPAGK